MSDKPLKGSMAAVDANTARNVAIVFGSIFTIAYLLFLIPSNLYTHGYFLASGWWKFICLITIPVHYWYVIVQMRKMENSAGELVPVSVIIFFGGFLLNIFLLAGWTFNLPTGSW